MWRVWLFNGVAAATIIFLSAATVRAGVSEGIIDVSFGGKDSAPVGKAVVGNAGDVWNVPDGNSGDSIALVNAKGAKTAVRLTFDADGTYDADRNSPFAEGPYANLMRHYLVATQERHVMLEKLKPGSRFTLYLYCAADPGGDRRVTKFTVGAQSKLTTFSVVNKEFTAGVNYTRLAVVAGRDGKISISYGGGDGPEGNLNGLQLVSAKGGEVTADDRTTQRRLAIPANNSSKPESPRRVAKSGTSHFAALGEWPCWYGPNHDGKSLDKGLLKQWPDAGPELLWKADDIGVGFSSAAISGGKVYISGDLDGKLMVFAFDSDGTLLWKAEHGPGRGGPDGSRGSPVIDGGNLYILSGNGLLGCFDAASGEKKWSRDAQEFGGSPGGWGYAESVLIYKNLAIFKPGGKNCIVALDKATGETVWKSIGFDAGPEYGSCLPVSFQGQEMIVTGTSRGIFAVAAQSGKLLWSNDWSAGNIANCPTPAYADGYLFWANGYGKGGVCLKLSKEDSKVVANVAWTTKEMVCHHGGYVIHDGYIYGNHEGGWTCLDLKTGEKKWHEKGVGKGSLCFADNMLYLFSESSGLAGLATCSPDGLKLKGKMKVAGSGPSWAHPVVIGGRLYLRYDTHLYCFDVKAATKKTSASVGASSITDMRMASADRRAWWMQDRIESLGSRPLKRLVLPASHDAAMYETGLLKSFAQTQDLTIYQQLLHGIRYFDLRPQWQDGKLVIHHGPIQGPDLSEVLNDVRRFAREGHRELVILKFSHYAGFSNEAYKGLIEQINATIGTWLYKSPSNGKRLADTTLAEFVGRTGAVLVLCDGDFPLQHRSDGIWVYRDWDSRHPEQGDLRVYDQYSNTVSYPAMKTDQFDKFNRYDGKCKARVDVPCDLFLLSWTLTPVTDVRGYTAEANRNLDAALKELKVPNRFGCVVNLLYADYVDSAKTTEIAIWQNEMLCKQ